MSCSDLGSITFTPNSRMAGMALNRNCVNSPKVKTIGVMPSRLIYISNPRTNDDSSDNSLRIVNRWAAIFSSWRMSFRSTASPSRSIATASANSPNLFSDINNDGWYCRCERKKRSSHEWMAPGMAVSPTALKRLGRFLKNNSKNTSPLAELERHGISSPNR